jgi:hypothetical protein
MSVVVVGGMWIDEGDFGGVIGWINSVKLAEDIV